MRPEGRHIHPGGPVGGAGVHGGIYPCVLPKPLPHIRKVPKVHVSTADFPAILYARPTRATRLSVRRRRRRIYPMPFFLCYCVLLALFPCDIEGLGGAQETLSSVVSRGFPCVSTPRRDTDLALSAGSGSQAPEARLARPAILGLHGILSPDENALALGGPTAFGADLSDLQAMDHPGGRDERGGYRGFVLHAISFRPATEDL